MTEFNFGYGSNDGLAEIKGPEWETPDNLHELSVKMKALQKAGASGGGALTNQFVDSDSTEVRAVVKNLFITNSAILDIGGNDILITGDLHIQNGRLNGTGKIVVAGNVIVERTPNDNSYINVLNVADLEVGGNVSIKHTSHGSGGKILANGDFFFEGSWSSFNPLTIETGGNIKIISSTDCIGTYNLLAVGDIDLSEFAGNFQLCSTNPGNSGQSSNSANTPTHGTGYGSCAGSRMYLPRAKANLIIGCAGTLTWNNNNIYLNGRGGQINTGSGQNISGENGYSCYIYAGLGNVTIPTIETAGGGGSFSWDNSYCYNGGNGGNGGNINLSSNITVVNTEMRGGKLVVGNQTSGIDGSDGAITLDYAILSDICPTQPIIVTENEAITNILEWNIPADANNSTLHFEIEINRVITESQNLVFGTYLSSGVGSENFSGTAPYAQGVGSLQFDLTDLGLVDGERYQFKVRALKSEDDTKKSVWSETRYITIGG